MKTVTVNCTSLDKAALIRELKAALQLPQWCGNNLDALCDCLSEIDEDTHLVLQNLPPLPALLETLLDAARENPFFSVTLGRYADSEDGS